MQGKFEVKSVLANLREDKVPAVIIFRHIDICPGDRHLVAFALSG